MFISMGGDYVSGLRPQRALLFVSQMIYEYGATWNNTDRGRPKNSEKNLRRLVAGVSKRSPWFAPQSVHVGFVVDKAAL
jgi:hypothetical protein